MTNLDLEASGADRSAHDDVRQARVAGLLYLVVIAGGLFAEVGVRQPLIVPGDAAGTTAAIVTNTSLWRWGLAVHLLYHLPAVVLYAILYRLFRPVHVTLARLGLLFGMVSLTVEAIAVQHLYLPLAVMQEGTSLAGLGEEQLVALTYLATRQFSTSWAFGLIHFAGFCIATGLLILRSNLVPRAIGVMMIVAGLCYPINSLTYSLARDLSDMLVPWILVPVLIGELSLALWLTVKGVNSGTGASRP